MLNKQNCYLPQDLNPHYSSHFLQSEPVLCVSLVQIEQQNSKNKKNI